MQHPGPHKDGHTQQRCRRQSLQTAEVQLRSKICERSKLEQYTVAGEGSRPTFLSGEIDMMLDDTSVHLQQGDVIVQQATNHAWINRGTQPCRILFVLMDSKEP
jgi:Cupin domain